jgi:HJR/Mrr/RecB family endonuclease
MPPVNSKEDQSWFADNLVRKASEPSVPPVDLGEIDVMEPKAFERWALSRCIVLGWEASETPKSYDGGADGILVHRATGARAIVQCKHKQSDHAPCGPEAIDDLLRARSSYAWTSRLFVLTNASRFSQSARERAERHGIELIGRSDLPLWPRQLSMT